MPVTQRQIRLLAPYLEGDRPTHINRDKETGTETREWYLKCPLHEDNKRSASLNIEKGVYYCNVCGGMPVTALIRRKAEWLPVRNAGDNGSGKISINIVRLYSPVGNWSADPAKL